MNLARIRTSEELEEEGAWTEVFNGDARIRVCYHDSQRVERARRQWQDAHPEAFTREARKGLGEKRFQELQREYETAILAAALVAWEGFEEDGAVVPVTPANAARLVRDYRPIREAVSRAMMSYTTFREEALADLGKGSSTTGASSATTAPQPTVSG